MKASAVVGVLSVAFLMGLVGLGFLAAPRADAQPAQPAAHAPSATPGATPSAKASALPSASASAAVEPPAPPVDVPPVEKPKPVPRPVATPREPGAELTISVLTFSPGDHPFFKFGHSAIWIHDASKPIRMNANQPDLRDRVFNWGMFRFDDPALIPKFFQGRANYALGVESLAATRYEYGSAHRSITVQELDLSNTEKLKLLELAETNLQPENREYKYDYYLDNCATRVRDIIDNATGGQLKEQLKATKAKFTFRDHTLRMTADLPPEAVILSLVMGDVIDQPITLWEEAFLPSEFQKSAKTVQITWEDGTVHQLVKPETVMIPSKQAPPPENPPSWWYWALVGSLPLGALMAALGWLSKRSIAPRILFGVLLSIFGLLIGFLGVFFLGAWAATDHKVGYHNENVFQCAPWAVLLVGGGIRIAAGDRWNRWVALAMHVGAFASAFYVASLVTGPTGVVWFFFWAACFGGYSLRQAILRKVILAAAIASALGLALKILPWFDQQNYFFILFFLPFWAGTAFGINAMRTSIRDVPNLTKKMTLVVVDAAAIAEKSAKDAAEAGKSATAKKKRKKPQVAAEEAKPEAKSEPETSAAPSTSAAPPTSAAPSTSAATPTSTDEAERDEPKEDAS